MSEAKSISLMQFQQEFKTEEECVSYLKQKRWKNGFSCPKCQHDQYYYLNTRKLFECRGCRHQTSITAGTIMHKSKLPLMTWFWAIYLVAHDKRGKSALSLSQILDLNYRTALRLLRKIRAAMKERDTLYTLSGTVEMDDSYFGAPRKGKRGRGTDKPKAMVALSKNKKNHPAYLRIQVIEEVSMEEIKRVTQACVEPGSRIVADDHKSFKSLEDIGYELDSTVYYKANKDVFLKMLHNVIGNAKTYIQGTYHGLAEKYLQSYFDEFCFRFNRRQNPNEMFDRLLNACALASPQPVS